MEWLLSQRPGKPYGGKLWAWAPWQCFAWLLENQIGNPWGGGGKDTLAVLSPWLECQTLQWLHCQILNSWLHCQILNSWLNCQILNSWLHCQIMNLWFDWQLLNLWLHSPNLLDWLPCQILIYHRHWNWNPAHLRSLLRPHQHLSQDPSHQKHWDWTKANKPAQYKRNSIYCRWGNFRVKNNSREIFRVDKFFAVGSIREVFFNRSKVLMETYTRECCVHGCHVYRRIWSSAVGEVLHCEREPTNRTDTLCLSKRTKQSSGIYLKSVACLFAVSQKRGDCLLSSQWKPKIF